MKITQVKDQYFKKLENNKKYCQITKIILCLIIQHFLFSTIVLAQTFDPYTSINLDDLSAFKNPSKNWQTSEDINYDFSYEKLIHKKGKGILIKSSNQGNDVLITNFEHGDMDLEFEFMLSKGSSPAVYLQNRYSISLNDSWGEANSIVGASGAIYQSSLNNNRNNLVPPRVNVCKAPGLWQHIKISFQSPRFDDTGKKSSNAIFKNITYNGVIIHENIEVPQPTLPNYVDNESFMGPLGLHGDEGIAIRNIRYKTYGDKKVGLSNLKYSYYEGKFENIPDFSIISSTKSKSTNEITWEFAENITGFALKFDGELLIPVSGTYIFEIHTPGFSRLKVNDKILIDIEKKKSANESAFLKLEKGNHSFTLVYVKDIPFGSPQLGFFVEGPGISRLPLHALSSMDMGSIDNPISINPENSTIVQRCFIEFNQEKKTFCVAVGEPGKIHYAMDLSQGAMIGFWKGRFIDATTMWTGRGEEQLAKPLGSGIELSPKPTLAILKNKDDIWPDLIQQTDSYQFQGYQLDEQGRPTFKFIFNNATIEDKITPENNKFFSRSIKINNEKKLKNLWLRLAEGSKIEKLKDGLYAVDDKSFYLKINQNSAYKPLIRKKWNGEELVVPVSDNQDQFQYSIIW